MFKAFFTLAVFAIVLPASAQRNIQDLISKYSSANINIDTAYILIQPAQNAPATILKILEVKAVRRLTNNLYIVEKSILKNIDLSYFAYVIPANNLWKLSNSTQSLLTNHWAGTFRFMVQFKDSIGLKNFTIKNKLSKTRTKVFALKNIVSIPATFEDINSNYFDDPDIIFIDVVTATPREELAVSGFDLTSNKINLLHNLFSNINGEGQHVSLKEQRIDTNDIDLKGRFDPSPLAAPLTTNHANIMATIIEGAGNSVWYARGVAPAARISSSDFATLLPDDNNNYLSQDITVQNHSYGTSIDNEYGLSAVAFDRSANINPALLHVFSSGNSGLDTSLSGTYTGIGGFANLTGNFKMAKNIMVVGGVDSFGIVAPQSSRGPAYDGRIKPDIVAFQMNGTSESAALVSGVASLLQQYYKSTHNGNPLPSAMARALLINSATEVGNEGPDFKSGFGNLNAYKAMITLKNNFIMSGFVAENEVQSFSIVLPPTASELKVSLCWNDPAATPAAPIALINDLDLSVSAGLYTYLPWTLNTAADENSLKQNAVRGRDSLNNEEQVTIKNIGGGAFTIHVNGFKLLSDSQQFYIAYEYDNLNSFQWQAPLKKDLGNAAEANTLRWESNISSPASLEYSYAPYNQWQTIASNINLKNSYLLWNTPSATGHVLLRMKTTANYFYSDTLLISQLANPKVGFICADSMLVYWNSIAGAGRYIVYTLGDKDMQPIKNVADTSTLLRKSQLPYKFVAVAPVIANDTGTRSYAFNYELQAAGCYINSFFAVIDGNRIVLSLNTGTSYLVDSITFEIKAGSKFETIYTADDIGLFNYEYKFTTVTQGVNYFRARIKLMDGTIIYSALQPVLYILPGNYVLSPNPLRKNETLNIYSGNSDNASIYIYDATGRCNFVKQISSAYETADIQQLSAGLYYYAIRKAGKKLASGKLVMIN